MTGTELLLGIFDAVASENYLAALLTVATFLGFTVLGIIFARRSGVFFLGAEGVLLVSSAGAYFGDVLMRKKVIGAALAGSDGYEALLARADRAGWIGGLLVGLAAGLLFTLLLSWFLLYVRSNTIVTGMAFNFLAYALCGMTLRLSNRQDIDVSSLTASPLPFVTVSRAADLPVLSGLFAHTSLFTYLALLAPLAAFYLLNRTDFGLRLRAAEQNPTALSSAGLNVTRTQLTGMAFAGLAVSLGGVTLSLAQPTPTFTSVPYGLGFLALAAVWACAGRLGRSCFGVLLLSLVGALPLVLKDLPVQLPLVDSLLYLAALAGMLLHSHNDRQRDKLHLRAQRNLVQGMLEKQIERSKAKNRSKAPPRQSKQKK